MAPITISTRKLSKSPSSIIRENLEEKKRLKRENQSNL